jgi:TatD DNase family protein
MFVDTHTHFYDEWLLPDAEQAVQRALSAGVGKMIQADVDSRERPAMWEIGDRHPGVLFQMAGLYPGSVTEENWQEELDLVAETVAARKVVAIGEIGLDYHEGKQFAALQKEVLRQQLELAARLDLPVNIHLRDAWEDFFELLSDCRHLHLRGNLHCFTANYEIYERANRWGRFSVGIGGVVTFKNATLAKTLERIPTEMILLETDAPYLTPVPHRGERNESAYIPLIAAFLARQKGIDVEEVAAVTTRNAKRLFAL